MALSSVSCVNYGVSSRFLCYGFEYMHNVLHILLHLKCSGKFALAYTKTHRKGGRERDRESERMKRTRKWEYDSIHWFHFGGNRFAFKLKQERQAHSHIYFLDIFFGIGMKRMQRHNHKMNKNIRMWHIQCAYILQSGKLCFQVWEKKVSLFLSMSAVGECGYNMLLLLLKYNCYRRFGFSFHFFVAPLIFQHFIIIIIVVSFIVVHCHLIVVIWPLRCRALSSATFHWCAPKCLCALHNAHISAAIKLYFHN